MPDTELFSVTVLDNNLPDWKTPDGFCTTLVFVVLVPMKKGTEVHSTVDNGFFLAKKSLGGLIVKAGSILLKHTSEVPDRSNCLSHILPM